MSTLRVATGAAFALALAGCVAAPESTGDPKPTFAAINKDIFEPNCTFACHSGGEFAAGGLDMKTDPYGSLVRARPTAMQCKDFGMLRVVPDQPEQSLLYVKVKAKLDDAPAPCGDGMPSGANKVALGATDAETIRRWIEDGALDD